MNKAFNAFCFFLGIAFSIPSMAMDTQSPNSSMVLEAELILDLKNATCLSAEIRGQRSNVARARANAEIQKIEVFPKVQIEGNYLHLDKTSTHTGFDSTINSKGKSTELKAVGSLTLYDGGLNTSKVRAAERSIDAEFELIAAVSQDLMLKIVDMYYKKIGAFLTLEAAKENSLLSCNLIRLARHRIRGGIGNAVDLALVEARDARIRVDLIQAENNFRDAQSALKSLTDSSLGRPCLMYGEGLGNRSVVFEIPSYEEAVAALPNQSAKLRSLRKKINIASENIEAAKNSNGVVVKAVLSKSINRNSKDDSSFGQRNSIWYGGVVFSYPIFSGFSTDKQVRMAVAEKEKSQNSFDEELHQEAATLKALYLQINSAETELTAYLSLLQANKIAAAKSSGRFQSGIGVLSDVLMAQSEFIDAKKSFVAAENKRNSLRGRLAVLLLNDALLK